MAVGDAGAAAGMTIYPANDPVNRGYLYANQRADDIAKDRTRLTKLESNAKTADRIYEATPQGGSGNTATKAVTSTVVIPKTAYARTAAISFRVLITDQTGDVDIRVQRNSADTLMQVRGRNRMNSQTGVWFDTIPANTQVTYRITAEAQNAGDTWEVSDTSDYTGMQIRVTSIS